MTRESIIFCTSVLILTGIVCALGFSLAAMPREAVAGLDRPVPPQTLPAVDLGPGFGKVSVLDLLAYYIENPPEPARNPAVPAVKRFRGC